MKCHFWHFQLLDVKIYDIFGMLSETGQYEHVFEIKFWIWKFVPIGPKVAWHWPSLTSNLKMNVTSEFYVQNGQHVSHGTCAAFSFSDLIWRDLDLGPCLVPIRATFTWRLLISLWKMLAKLGFAAVISPVSVTDSVKSDILDQDLAVTGLVTF